MDAKADARPFTGRIRPDQRQPLVFADDREFAFLRASESDVAVKLYRSG